MAFWQDDEICVLVLLCREWTLSAAQIHELFNKALPGRRTMNATRLCTMYKAHANNDQTGAMWFYWDRAQGPPFSQEDLNQFSHARTEILNAGTALGIRLAPTGETKFQTWLESDEERNARSGKSTQKLAEDAKSKVRPGYVTNPPTKSRPGKSGDRASLDATDGALPNVESMSMLGGDDEGQVKKDSEDEDALDSSELPAQIDHEGGISKSDAKLLNDALALHAGHLVSRVVETVNAQLAATNRAFSERQVSAFFKRHEVVLRPGIEREPAELDDGTIQMAAELLYQTVSKSTDPGREEKARKDQADALAEGTDPGNQEETDQEEDDSQDTSGANDEGTEDEKADRVIDA